MQRHFDNWNIIRHLSTVVPWPYLADGVETFFAFPRSASITSTSATPPPTTPRVGQKTGAEFVGFIELAHHGGQSKSEKWIVRREAWLRARRAQSQT
jgi:hypothetical protein